LLLDDDTDAGAFESFWNFVSSGSPFLSAFEWILMLHHLSCNETLLFDASDGSDEGILPNVQMQIPALIEDNDGVSPGNCCSDATSGYSNGVDGLNASGDSDVDAMDAVSVGTVGDDADADHVSQVERTFSRIDAVNHASTLSRDHSCASPESAAVADGGMELNAVLDTAQSESLDPLPGTDFAVDSQDLGGSEDAKRAAAAVMFDDHLVANIADGQASIALGQDEEGVPLPAEVSVAATVSVGGSCTGAAELLTSDALAASAHLDTLRTGTGSVANSENQSDSSATYSRDIPSRMDSAALSVLAQVMCSFFS
jgi:hypothetical protein